VNSKGTAAGIPAERGRHNSVRCQPAHQSCCLPSHVFQVVGSA
jgi:hypothetical protein